MSTEPVAVAVSSAEAPSEGLCKGEPREWRAKDTENILETADQICLWWPHPVTKTSQHPVFMQTALISSPICLFLKTIYCELFLHIPHDPRRWCSANTYSQLCCLLPCEATPANSTLLASLHPLARSSPGGEKGYISGRRNRPWNSSLFFPPSSSEGKAADSQFHLYLGWRVSLSLKSYVHKTDLSH